MRPCQLYAALQMPFEMCIRDRSPPLTAQSPSPHLAMRSFHSRTALQSVSYTHLVNYKIAEKIGLKHLKVLEPKENSLMKMCIRDRYIIAQIHNFIWCKYWIFPVEKRQNNVWKQILFFCSAFGVAYTCLLYTSYLWNLRRHWKCSMRDAWIP